MPTRMLVACRAQAHADAVATAICRPGAGAIVASTTILSGVLARAAVENPDVVVLEHGADEEKLPALMVQLQSACPSTRVLLLCDAYTSSMMVEFIRLGASGCLVKGTPGPALARGVMAVQAGEPWFGRRELLEALRSRIAAEPAGTPAIMAARKLLTAREREVLALIGAGMSNKEIGRRLEISDKTVKTHLHRVYVKLQQSGRYKAFVCNGWPLPDAVRPPGPEDATAFAAPRAPPRTAYATAGASFRELGGRLAADEAARGRPATAQA